MNQIIHYYDYYYSLDTNSCRAGSHAITRPRSHPRVPAFIGIAYGRYNGKDLHNTLISLMSLPIMIIFSNSVTHFTHSEKICRLFLANRSLHH